MKIETHHIPSQGVTLTQRFEADHFSVIHDLIQKGEVSFAGPIDVTLTVAPERDLFLVKGTLETTLELDCSRCLVLYKERIQSKFSLNYSRDIPMDVHGADYGQIELTAGQIGVMFYEGEEIDFTGALGEQVLLAMPFKPLCDPSCRGLCSLCGINLNQTRCQCDNRIASGPFESLKNLKLPPR